LRRSRPLSIRSLLNYQPDALKYFRIRSLEIIGKFEWKEQWGNSKEFLIPCNGLRKKVIRKIKILRFKEKELYLSKRWRNGNKNIYTNDIWLAAIFFKILDLSLLTEKRDLLLELRMVRHSLGLTPRAHCSDH